MKIEKLIEWLKNMVTYYESEREVRDEIIKRLEDYGEMRAIITNSHLTQEHTMRDLLKLVELGK